MIGGVGDIASGRCERAVVGVVDEMTPLTHGILDRFGALARGTGTLTERARPFSRQRNGMVVGEGCTLLVLEDEGVARERGAPVLARVAASARASDPTAPPHSWGRGGRRLANSLARRLTAQGVDLARIDRIVSGASGSVEETASRPKHYARCGEIGPYHPPSPRRASPASTAAASWLQHSSLPPVLRSHPRRTSK